MQFNLLLQNRRFRLLLIAIAAILLLLMMIAGVRSCTKKEPTIEEIRLAQINYLTQLIEAYKERYGSYPQPTARAETPEGIRHVWGYEVDRPSLPSCTIALSPGGVADPERSRCGGGVYDINGNLIGWKGTLTMESGLNNIEIATRGSGRINSPLSEFARSIPLDPAYAGNAALAISGFGEYVYAIRNPETANTEKREEYQIAATVQDPVTKEESTLIRGNYFVRSDERERMPSSLIGPGLLFDSHDNPVEGQTKLLHSLLDGQKKGFPNPAFGDGEETLRSLTLKRRAERLLSSIEERILLLTQLPASESATAIAALETARKQTQDILGNLESVPATQAAADIGVLEADLTVAATNIPDVMETFLADYAATVSDILKEEAEKRDVVMEVLHSAFDVAKKTEESVLVARDEVLTYLDGQGIEEQTRSRVARKLETILEELPDLSALFEARSLFPMNVFLTGDLQKGMLDLKERETIAVASNEEMAEPSGDSSPDAESPDAIEKATYAMTVASELSVHFAELESIVTNLLDEVMNSGMPIDELDGELRRLGDALASEHERIGGLLDDIADVSAAEKLKLDFDSARSTDVISALSNVALSSYQRGDFTGLRFNPLLLDQVILEESPGIPDLGSHENKLEATYQGIPYPLP